MKKIKFIALCLSVILFSTFIGCGKSNEQSKGESQQSGDVVNIVIDDLVEDNIGFNVWLKERQAAFDRAYPNIKVKHVPEVAGDAFNQLKTVRDAFSVVSANAPTILPVNTNEYARQLYYEGYIKPFTSQINSWEEKADINSAILDGYTYNGEIVGFPITIETPVLGFNKKVLLERKDELAKIGQDYTALKIETWEDYKNIAKVLTYTNASGVKVSGAGMTTQDYYQSFGVWATANGFDGVVQNEDGTVSIDWAENESMVETIKLFADLKAEGSITMNIDVSTTNYFSYIWKGAVASFTYYPEWATWFAANNLDSSNIDIYNFPAGNHAVKNGINGTSPIFSIGYVVNSKASDAQVDAAAKYIEFMYGKDAWESKINFAYDNMIQFVTYPVLGSVDLTKIYVDLTDNWKNAIDYALTHMHVGKINTIGYTTDIRSMLSDLVSTTDVNAINQKLAQLEETTKLSWLNNYNDNVKGR